jgi:4-aminobutyrate aminotransferase-like enzyme
LARNIPGLGPQHTRPKKYSFFAGKIPSLWHFFFVTLIKFFVNSLLPSQKTNIPGPQSLSLSLELRESENHNITYIDPKGRFPIFWESSKDCLVTDVDSNVFLDMTAAFGVMAVGHSNPRVAQAIATQSAKLIHGMGDVHPTRLKAELCAKICEKTGLTGVILGQNGGDAIEAAIKTARLYTGKPGVIAFSGGYHGLTFGALAATYREDFKAPFSGQMPPFAHHLPYGEAITEIPDSVGGILVEPIQGRGGIIVPPTGWLSHLRQICDKNGLVFILDEIFTGFGRTGDWFAHEFEGVTPDVLCIGKAMGGGFPLSACVGKAEVMAAWTESQGEALHTSTFLGSPLGCAAALAAIGELEEKELPARAKVMGMYFYERLLSLQSEHADKIIAVRGRGLMLGIEMISTALAQQVVLRLLQLGVIVLPAGDGEVIEFTPPLIVTEEQIEFVIAALHSCV